MRKRFEEILPSKRKVTHFRTAFEWGGGEKEDQFRRHFFVSGICHRDIKPQNLLIDTETAVLKLCDFGSAKYLVRGEPNVSYICSRYYRAPELIFGATNYTNR